MKVINFGSLNIDNVYKVEHFVAPGETSSSLGFEMHCGGKGLNQSVALAQAGVEVYHAGKIGKDGIFLLEFLESKGVNVDNIMIDEHEKTGHAIILVDESGENSILLYSGANNKIKKNEVVNTLLKFSSKDILLIQNEINNLSAIINTAADMGMYIVMNPSPINEDLLKLPLHRVNLFILNLGEARVLTGAKREETILRGLKKKFPTAEFVVTLGKNGSIYYHPRNDIRIDIEADTVRNVVDSTGAGDTFLGYFLAGRIFNQSIKRCLKVASYAAAISVTRKGAAESIPRVEYP